MAEREFLGETERLILRPWRESEAEILYAYAKDPVIGNAAGWQPHPSVAHSLEIIRTVFAAPETYAVVLKATGEPVGSIGLMFADGMHSAPIGPGEAEIGYWIGAPHWGRGLASEASSCLLCRGFSALGLSAVWAGYYDGNLRSRRVMEKCGFVFHHTASPSLPSEDSRVEHFMRLTADGWREWRERHGGGKSLAFRSCPE